MPKQTERKPQHSTVLEQNEHVKESWQHYLSFYLFIYLFGGNYTNQMKPQA